MSGREAACRLLALRGHGKSRGTVCAWFCVHCVCLAFVALRKRGRIGRERRGVGGGMKRHPEAFGGVRVLVGAHENWVDDFGNCWVFCVCVCVCVCVSALGVSVCVCACTCVRVCAVCLCVCACENGWFRSVVNHTCVCVHK